MADYKSYELVGGLPVKVEPLTANEEGTYFAPMGHAFNPVIVVDVPNSYTADDVGMVVVSSGASYELQSQTARSESITANGTYDTTYNNEVTVNVDGGYKNFSTITGTLANPWGSRTFADIMSAVNNFMVTVGAMPVIGYDATAISAGTGQGALYFNGNNLVAMGADITSSTSRAFTMTWDANGLVSAYMEQNGTITDISQYDSLITTTIYLPTKGE